MKIAIDGRELPFPVLDDLTFRESQLIKKVTGLKMGQFADALAEGDTDMLFAMALLAKMREDGVVDVEALLDTQIAKIEVIDDDEPEEPADASPPDAAAEAAAVEPAS